MTLGHPVSPQASSTGRYNRLRRLGTGGMGVVYEAEDRERDHRVALKTLRNATPDALYQLKREFRQLADLSHPNIAQLYDLAADGDEWFYTMELVTGVDFITYCVRRADDTTERRFDEARVRAALSQLAEGINALHGAGKVHRDVKPSNVLVTEQGRVVLLDFGLVTDARSEDETLSSRFAGTVAYMAPEQAELDGEVCPVRCSRARFHRNLSELSHASRRFVCSALDRSESGTPCGPARVEN